MGDKGFTATSLRDITTAADVNLASVNYHFGSKEALLAAVLERRLQPINERRLQLLDELELRSPIKPVELSDIVRAFMSPPFEQQQTWGSSGQTFFRLLGRIHSETNEDFREVFMSKFEVVFQRFSTALRRSLPHLDSSSVNWRMLFMVGSMAFTMSWGQAMVSRDRKKFLETNGALEALVAFTSAGLAAPLPRPAPVTRQQEEAE